MIGLILLVQPPICGSISEDRLLLGVEDTVDVINRETKIQETKEYIYST